jgi:hypothetical protein
MDLYLVDIVPFKGAILGVRTGLDRQAFRLVSW